jgi:uncharacterized protein (DUF1800 family)
MDSGNALLRPIADDQFDMVAAWHLLNRAGFGGSFAQVEALRAMGLTKAVDLLVDYQQVKADPFVKPEYDLTIIRPPTAEEAKAMREARRSDDKVALAKIDLEKNLRQVQDREQMSDLQDWWLGRMISTPRPLEEKLTLGWHSHFATNYRTVRDSAMMVQQNFFFRENANGNFVTLLRGIIREPAMLKFLNNDSNSKDKPNENLAREIMELFSLGVGNYSETDIKEGARALTGYGRNERAFNFYANKHDTKDKRILGKSANFDGDGFVGLLLAQPACARWVARKFVRWFASDIDGAAKGEQAAVIDGLADELVKNSYEIAPTLKTLFKSRYFYSDVVMGNQIKSPVQLIVSTVRSLQTPTRDLRVLVSAGELMGQELFEPPSVAGWDTGRSWINSATMFVRQNLAVFLLTGKLPYQEGWRRSDMEYNPNETVLAGLKGKTADDVVNRLMFVMLGPRSTPKRKAELMSFVAGRTGGMTDDVIVGVMLTISAMPEYQVG